MQPLRFTLVALGLVAVGTCFPQQAPRTSQQEAEAVVIRLYREVVFRKRAGIPWTRTERRAIWPLLSRDLIEHLKVAKWCENDYFRQRPDPNLKPAYDWLEFGLFSGGNEATSPSRFGLLRTIKQIDGSYQVRVKLTWWGESDKHGPPRGPAYVWNWEVVVFVVRDGDHFAINDVLYSKETDETGLRLSQLLNHGCKDGKWIGYPDGK